MHLPAGETPNPLPNLEHRTVVANSLTDFVNGVEGQNTREGQGTVFEELDPKIILGLRHEYFSAHDPDLKETLADELAEAEDALIGSIFDQAKRYGEKGTEAQEQLEQLAERFRSWDREFPLFAPSFHAPDVWRAGGFDITIMNPPYLSRKEARQHLDSMRLADYERHFASLNDLMILFARRARQLTHEGGVISMIFNDSLFTSSDAEELRCGWFESDRVLVCARTKCFEGKAIIGGVVVSQVGRPNPPPPVRWVEGYRRPPADFTSASDPLKFSGKAGAVAKAGQMEVFSAPAHAYRELPHRPLFRPSLEAIGLLDRFTAVERWDALGKRDGWDGISNTRALERQLESLRQMGWYAQLRLGQWVLLGYVIEGGQGLATADDKHFIGAIEGTEAADDNVANQLRLEELVLGQDGLRVAYERLRKSDHDREVSLLALWDALSNDAALSRLWPKGATFRVASEGDVRTTPLTPAEKRDGIDEGAFWVPFEKGDESQDGMGARWTRNNPLVIDWSAGAVRVLRSRANSKSPRRKPRIQNEVNWFREGITWNRVASFLRCRRVLSTAIFSSEAPTIRPTTDWLPTAALLALLNSDTVDFLLRTFLGSRMHIEIGDVRRVPVPVLSHEESAYLVGLAESATEAKLAVDRAIPLRSRPLRVRSTRSSGICTACVAMPSCGLSDEPSL